MSTFTDVTTLTIEGGARVYGNMATAYSGGVVYVQGNLGTLNVSQCSMRYLP